MSETAALVGSAAAMPEGALRKACEKSGFRLITSPNNEEVCVPPNVELRWKLLSSTDPVYDCEMWLPDDRDFPFGRAVVVLTPRTAVVTFKWVEWRQNGKVVIVSLEENEILLVV